MRKVIRVLKTPVTLLVLLGILGYGAVWGYQHATMDITRPVAACVPQDVGKILTSDKVTVRVYNGGTVGSRAKNTRFYLITHDFHVIHYNNTARSVETTTVIGNSADDPEVRLVAQMFSGSVTEGDGRPDHVVDVIVGNKNQQLQNPVNSIPVDGPVCLPVIATGTESPAASTNGSPSPSATATPSK